MATEAFILKECALLSLLALKSLFMLIYAVVMVLVLPFRGRRRVSPVEKDEKHHECHRKGTVVRVPAKIVPWKSSIGVSSGGGAAMKAMDQAAAAVVARRELAMRRVVEDDDQSCVREYWLLGTKRGDTIFTQSWTPVSVKIRGLVFLMHGLNEHSGRYSDFAKQLNSNGYKVYAMDWVGLSYLDAYLCDRVTCEAPVYKCFIRGLYGHFQKHVYDIVRTVLKEHQSDSIDPPRCLQEQDCGACHCHGGSDGLHAYVHSLDDAVSDMKVFLEKVLTENPGIPCFCFGHSTGSAITLKALLDPTVEAYIAGAAFTSPAVGVEPSHPILLVLAPVVSFLLPRYQCSSAYKKGLPVSRDPQALIAKYSDPLVCTGSLRVRTGYEILRITRYLQQNLRKLRVPFLVLHGTADSVTEPDASQKLYEEASSSDKSIKLYEGFSHDLLFEPERDAITQDIIQWLNSKI